MDNVKLRLDDQYTFSISQETERWLDKPNLVEVALLEKRDGVAKGFVNCGEWASNWVADPTDADDVVRFVDAHDVADLLLSAKEYIYTKDNR